MNNIALHFYIKIYGQPKFELFIRSLKYALNQCIHLTTMENENILK